MEKTNDEFIRKLKVLVVADISTGGVYIKEFVNYLNRFVVVIVSFDEFWKCESTFDIVHLHWPEYISGWKEPDDNFIYKLQTVLNYWHEHSKVVSTRHNFHPHEKDSVQYKKLYELVYKYTHLVIHLGEFSRNDYVEKYKESVFIKIQKQSVIFHPYFTSYKNDINRTKARKYFNIDNDAKLMLVFGNIRNKEENRLIKEVFKKIPYRKILLVTRWYKQPRPSIRKSFFKYILWLINNFHIRIKKNYIIESGFVNDDLVQYYFNAADFVFIPRLYSLNSGIIPLAYFFATPILCPNIGNLKEMAELGGNKLFDVNLNNIKHTIKDLIENKEIYSQKGHSFALSELNPEKIALKLVENYNSILTEEL